MTFVKAAALAILFPAIGTHGAGQPGSGDVVCTERVMIELTHAVVPAGPVPTAFDPNGVYPYVSFCETANRPVPVRYRVVVLENDHIRVTVCPDLGGKVVSMIHKPSGREVLYVPEVVRPTRILPRFYFVAGGIEVSFPISHSPSQNDPVLYAIDRAADRVYVSCGERELRFGMHWTVEYSLGPSDAFLTQRAVFHNPGKAAHPWMSWSNAALPCADDTEFHFPAGKVLSHSSKLDTIDWKSRGPARESDIREMTGYFWITRNANAFGAYTPSFGCGIYHVADEAVSPGMKLWSYGSGDDSAWSLLSTARKTPYIEIQGGPIRDQSLKLELRPDETRWHTEYWIPSDKPVDIFKLKVPLVELRPLRDVPRFEWARTAEVKAWNDLRNAFEAKCEPPDPPDILLDNWAPSGMEDLGPAFEWAVAKSGADDTAAWKFYYGAWSAGRGDTTAAIRSLSESGTGVAEALLARLLRLRGDNQAAVRVYRSISEEWVQLHPQVTVERDKALRSLGNGTLDERETWLNRVDALRDEWVAERRVQWLIDKGDAAAAKKLLLSVPFQKVHQTYTRTNLWIQICRILGEPPLPIPEQLGEDRLARFGAYREFE